MEIFWILDASKRTRFFPNGIITDGPLLSTIQQIRIGRSGERGYSHYVGAIDAIYNNRLEVG
jgi:hypothetical protein